MYPLYGLVLGGEGSASPGSAKNQYRDKKPHHKKKQAPKKMKPTKKILAKKSQEEDDDGEFSNHDDPGIPLPKGMSTSGMSCLFRDDPSQQ